MLWSRPDVAQRASVLRLIGTLADAKISAASARLIQSDATRGTGQPPAVSAALDAGLSVVGDRPEALPSLLEALPSRPDALPSRPDASPSRPDALPSRPDALPSRPDALPSRPDVALSDEVAASFAGALPPVPPSVGEASPAAFAPRPAAVRASTLAHPDPLKTMAGDEIALRSVPPQTSHVVGRGDSMPWNTSTRRAHASQTYS
jgi:hypothetical protein